MNRNFKIALIVVMVLGFALTVVFAGPLDGLKGGKGSNLKKEDKTLKLSDLNASLKKYEGTDLDPAKTVKAGYTVFGDADFDKFSASTARVKLALGFANLVVSDANVKVDKVTKKDELNILDENVKAAQDVLKPVTTDAGNLVSSGQSISTSIAGKMKSDPLGYGANGKAMMDIVNAGIETGKNAPPTIKKLGDDLITIAGKLNAKKSQLTQ